MVLLEFIIFLPESITFIVGQVKPWLRATLKIDCL